MREETGTEFPLLSQNHSYSNVNLPRKWSQLSYAGEIRVPEGTDVYGGSWPLFLLKRDKHGNFLTPEGEEIDFAINEPDTINFDKELLTVQQTLKNLTPSQAAIARYWSEGPATKQWTPIVDRLIDTYDFSPVRAAHVLAAVQSAINDTFVVVWYFKYLWDIPRPDQLDQKLKTLLCTPKFPAYPSGHSTIAGCAEVLLSYFFAPEAARLKELAEEAAVARLYAGVHFPSDNDQGLRLGRQIGSLIVNFLSKQHDAAQTKIDIPVTKNLHANLMPPPYTQVIPYNRPMICTSLILKDNTSECTNHPSGPNAQANTKDGKKQGDSLKNTSRAQDKCTFI